MLETAKNKPMITTQIINLARRKILESTEEIFDNETLLLYANLCKDELVKRYLGKKLIKNTTLNFSGGSVAKPTNWNGHYFSSDNPNPNQGTEYKFVSIEDFQNGAYPYMLCEDGDNLKVYPVSVATLYTWYWSKTTDMALSPSIVNPPTELDDLLHECIVYGIVYRALEDAQDFELSKFFNDKFEAEFEKRTMAISQLEESSQEAGSLLNPLPDLNFSAFGGAFNDPNRW